MPLPTADCQSRWALSFPEAVSSLVVIWPPYSILPCLPCFVLTKLFRLRTTWVYLSPPVQMLPPILTGSTTTTPHNTSSTYGACRIMCWFGKPHVLSGSIETIPAYISSCANLFLFVFAMKPHLILHWTTTERVVSPMSQFCNLCLFCCCFTS